MVLTSNSEWGECPTCHVEVYGLKPLMRYDLREDEWIESDYVKMFTVVGSDTVH